MPGRRLQSVGGAVALALSAAAAGAQTQPPPIGPPAPRVAVMTNPDWLRRPEQADVMRVYPAAALAESRRGRASIRCVTTAMGELSGCVVWSEDPPGLGFGAAALALASTFQMRATTRDGRNVEGASITIPIRFSPPAPPAPPIVPGQDGAAVVIPLRFTVGR